MIFIYLHKTLTNILILHLCSTSSVLKNSGTCLMISFPVNTIIITVRKLFLCTPSRNYILFVCTYLICLLRVELLSGSLWFSLKTGIITMYYQMIIRNISVKLCEYLVQKFLITIYFKNVLDQNSKTDT